MLLRAEHIGFSYRKGVEVLRDVDFQIAEGEIVGLLGSSGCGKSTLAKIASGRLNPSSGSVTWDGNPLPSHAYRPVQLVYQHPERAINPRWPLGKTMCEAWNPPQELQEAMGIEAAWLNRWPNELSGGELQRFCIIRALAPATKILLCDEITTMLDAVTQAQLWNLLRDIARKRGMGLLVITHNTHLAARICDRIVTMP